MITHCAAKKKQDEKKKVDFDFYSLRRVEYLFA
jgi:hypothetical protein